MPVIKKYEADKHDFKCNQKKSDNPDKLAWVFWAYLGDNIGVEYSYTKGGKYNYMAIKEDDENGLMFWKVEEECWKPYGDTVQEAYSNYIAERELLDKE